MKNSDFQLKGKKDKIGYATRWSSMINGKRHQISMAREILRVDKNKEPDHINRNSLDNRKYNLRVVSRKENNDNRGIWGTSKYKYVHWDKSRNKWVANKHHNFIGRYRNEKDAIRAVEDSLF